MMCAPHHPRHIRAHRASLTLRAHPHAHGHCELGKQGPDPLSEEDTESQEHQWPVTLRRRRGQDA